MDLQSQRIPKTNSSKTGRAVQYYQGIITRPQNIPKRELTVIHMKSGNRNERKVLKLI
jgi:hypothetical protein